MNILMYKPILFVLFLPLVSPINSLLAQKTIEVVGRAETSVQPNRFEINIILREYQDGKTKKNIEALEKGLLKALDKSGIPKEALKVSSFSGNRYNWKKKSPEFMAMKSYQLKLEDLGLLDLLVKNMDFRGLNNIFLTKATRNDIEKIQKANLVKALKAAKEKADELLKSIGKSTGEVINISEANYPNFPKPMNRRVNTMAIMQDDQAETGSNVDPQLIRVVNQIFVVYEIKNP
jgi:uncharacterized protein